MGRRSEPTVRREGFIGDLINMMTFSQVYRKDIDDPKPTVSTSADEDVVWSREDLQRVLYHICTTYRQWQGSEIGVDNEFTRDAIRIGIETLKDNNWWDKD